MANKLSRSELKRLLAESKAEEIKLTRDQDDLDQKAVEGFQYLETPFDASMTRLDERFGQALDKAEKSRSNAGAKVHKFAWVHRVAAIALVLVLASYFLFQSRNGSELYDNYFEPPSSHYYQATRGGTGMNDLTTAFIPYEKGDFAAAYTEIISAQESHPDRPDLTFYAAISKLGEGDAEAAIPMFKACLSIEYQGVNEMAPWYLGLAYLKLGNVSEAKQYFEQVPGGSRYGESAAELLAKL